MKIKLEQLTIGQFIDLVSGDYSLLFRVSQKVSPKEATGIIRDVVVEYKEIADPSGAKKFVSDSCDLSKARLSLVLLEMCQKLLGLNHVDEVKEILFEYGIDAGKFSEAMIQASVKSNIEKLKRQIEDLESGKDAEDSDSGNIRRQFDEQTAALMAYFKFQIDTDVMKATVYAHLVARHNREIKSQLAAMKKK